MTSCESRIGYAGLAQHRKALKKLQHPSTNLKGIVNSKAKSCSNHQPVDAANYGKSLSDVLCNANCSNDLKRANLAGKFISKIDAVEARFRNLESLLLGNNDLICINGIQQFSHLRSLSLVNNLIEDFEQTQALQKLTRLEVLHVNGCPLTRRPNYVAYLASTLPTLRKLDSIIISRQERELAQSAVVRQKSMISIMVANETTIRIVQSLQCKIRLHMELIQTAYGRVRIFNRTDFKPSNLHQLSLNEAVKVLSFTQDGTREEIRAEMVRRVEMVWRSTYQVPEEGSTFGLITQSWDYALSEAMAIQQELLASAICSAEIARCEAQTQVKLLIKRRRYPAGDFLRPTLQSELKDKNHARSVSFSPKRKTVKFLRGQDKRPKKTLQRYFVAPVHTEVSDGSESPSASCQTQANQSGDQDGQQRIMELESLNLKLIGKLQQFHHQNRENVVQAEADAQRFSSQVERLSMSLRDVQQQVQYYRCDRDRYQAIVSAGISPDSVASTFVNKINELERLLESNQKQLTEYKCEIENQRRILRDKDEQIQLCSSNEQCRQTKDARTPQTESMLEAEFCDGDDSHHVGVLLSLKSLHIRNRLKAALSTWKCRMNRKHALRRLKIIAGQTMKAQIWSRWISMLNCARYKKALNKRRLFRKWRHLLSIRSQRRLQNVMMQSMQQKRCTRLWWHVWRRALSRNQQCPITPDRRANEFHTSSILRSNFIQWRSYVLKVAHPWRQKCLASKYFHLMRCISKFWSLWKEALVALKVDHSRYRLADSHYHCTLERQVFLNLRQFAIYSNRKKNLMQQSYNFRAHQIIQRWRQVMKIRSYWNSIIAEIRSQWSHRRRSVLFNCWLARWRLCTKETQALTHTVELDKLRSMKSAYSRWCKTFGISRAFRTSNTTNILNAKNCCFQEWSRLTKYRMNYRRNQMVLVTKMVVVSRHYQLKEALRRMLYLCRSEVHYQFVFGIVDKRRTWRLIRCTFHQWITTWLLNLLTTARTSLHDANSDLDCLKIERENMSSDAIRFADTVTKLRDTILQQSLAIANKEAAFERLQAAHDKLEDQIEAMVEKEDALLRDIHTVELKCQSALNEKEIISIRYEELKDNVIKMQFDVDKTDKRHSNIVRAIEAVLTESMVVLVSSNFRSTETLKEWIQQIIRHLQHMLYSSWNDTESHNEAKCVSQPITADSKAFPETI